MQKPGILFLLIFSSIAWANIFLHSPRGSNNRGCERNQNSESRHRLFNGGPTDTKGGYGCPYAFPYACYQLPVEADRDQCNLKNTDQDYDDISELNMMDNGGVLDESGTRTPRMYFYEGSILSIEWTNSLGCGENPRVHCDIIVQYACEDTLSDDCGEPGSGKTCGPRDGVPMVNREVSGRGSAVYQSAMSTWGWGSESIDRNSRDQKSQVRIPVSTSHNVQSDPRFGRHEPLSYYIKCATRQRNKGLWTADRWVGDAATSTRQGSSRHGFECNEESHYYPYWAPSPWKDIAIFTNRWDRCPWLVSQSQNVAWKYECDCPTCFVQRKLTPITEKECTQIGGQWKAIPPHGIAPPFCGGAPTTRENQLGNPIGGGKSASAFNWTVPAVNKGDTCVIRIRYNVTSGDYSSKTPGLRVPLDGTSLDNNLNSPVFDPWVSKESEKKMYKTFDELPLSEYPGATLGLMTRTDRIGVTFQDRSWSFSIKKPPTGGECANKVIYNLNMRGKRGNIVQAFPAVEYDFVPSELHLTDLDCVHVQWTGTDYQEARNSNDAYGGPPDPLNLNNGRADRHNLVQIYDSKSYQPVVSLDYHWNMFTTSRQRKIHLAFIGQPIEDTNVCATIESILALSARARNDPNNPMYRDKDQNYLDDNNDRDRYYKNCGKLSGALTPYFDGGLFVPGPPGVYAFLSTRGNSFSNRNQAGIMVVYSGFLVKGYIVPVIGGGLLLAFAGVFFYRRRSKNQDLILPDKQESRKSSGSSVPTAPAPVGGLTSGLMLPSSRKAKPAPATTPPGAGSTTVTAIHNHTASEAGELEFRKGDVITVLRKDASGWWEGRTPDGKKGIFPSNYVA